MKNALISVIMSTYNERIDHLRQAVESILNQTYENFEFLIVLDNPNNAEIREYLEEVAAKDGRVKLLPNEKNIGLANSLNRAFFAAKGEYIARMDADDISLPTRFEKQLAYLQANPVCDVLTTDREDIGEEGEPLPTTHIIVASEKDVYKALEYGSIFTHPSAMLRKGILDKVGGYRNFSVTEDYDLWLRLRKQGARFTILPERLLRYRIRSTGISKSNVAKLHAYALYAQYLDKIEKAGENLMSEENLAKFLRKKKFYTDKDREKYNRAYAMLTEGTSVWRILRAATLHKEAVLYMLRSRKKDKLLKGYIVP